MVLISIPEADTLDQKVAVVTLMSSEENRYITGVWRGGIFYRVELTKGEHGAFETHYDWKDKLTFNCDDVVLTDLAYTPYNMNWHDFHVWRKSLLNDPRYVAVEK